MRPATAFRRAALAAVLGGLCLAAGCGEISILNPAGPVGAANRTILLNSLVIMLAIVVPTMIATLLFAWWFRAGNAKARYRPDFTYSGRIELIVWSIPTLVILFLGGLIWIGSHQLDPKRPLAGSDRPPLKVQVVSLDWKWLFIYPDQGIASVNQLTVPAGTPIEFQLTSASVMNTFFIPQLGSMIYTMNGMQTTLHLQADRPGTFYGQSAHYSGDGFSGMNFDLRAVDQAAFDGFVADTRRDGPALDDAAYAELARQSQDVEPFTYRSVTGDLFGRILRLDLPPAPGPVPADSPKPGSPPMALPAAPPAAANDAPGPPAAANDAHGPPAAANDAPGPHDGHGPQTGLPGARSTGS